MSRLRNQQKCLKSTGSFLALGYNYYWIKKNRLEVFRKIVF